LRYIILGLILAGLFQVFFWITQDHQVSLNQDSFESIESLSYSPYEGYDKKLLSANQIEEDIKVLSFFTKKLRTYSTTDAEAILKVISNPKGVVRTVISIAILAIIVGIAYSLSSTEAVNLIGNTEEISNGSLILADTTLYASYILTVLVVLAIIASEVKRLLKF